jgi:hypothetical protein
VATRTTSSNQSIFKRGFLFGGMLFWRYERNRSENECMPVLPLASILHPRFKDMNFLDEDDRNAAIELLKANAVATANNNSLHTTIKEEPRSTVDDGSPT